MGKRPTGSGGEPSSPNRETSAEGKARHLLTEDLCARAYLATKVLSTCGKHSDLPLIILVERDDGVIPPGDAYMHQALLLHRAQIQRLIGIDANDMAQIHHLGLDKHAV